MKISIENKYLNHTGEYKILGNNTLIFEHNNNFITRLLNKGLEVGEEYDTDDIEVQKIIDACKFNIKIEHLEEFTKFHKVETCKYIFSDAMINNTIPVNIVKYRCGEITKLDIDCMSSEDITSYPYNFVSMLADGTQISLYNYGSGLYDTASFLNLYIPTFCYINHDNFTYYTSSDYDIVDELKNNSTEIFHLNPMFMLHGIHNHDVKAYNTFIDNVGKLHNISYTCLNNPYMEEIFKYKPIIT